MRTNLNTSPENGKAHREEISRPSLSTRPKALDLFCGGGGASTGLHRAGFDVTGVDINPQPRYPFRFHQADALEFPLDGFDFVWASPPCQRFTTIGKRRETHPDLIPATRKRLVDAGAPYCIENVPGSPLRRDLVLSGGMFGLLTHRRRQFEVSFLVLAPEPETPFGPKTVAGACTVTGNPGGSSRRDGWKNGGLAQWKRAMGIDWMTARELSQAIPPAYSEFIGRAAIEALGFVAHAPGSGDSEINSP